MAHSKANAAASHAVAHAGEIAAGNSDLSQLARSDFTPFSRANDTARCRRDGLGPQAKVNEPRQVVAEVGVMSERLKIDRFVAFSLHCRRSCRAAAT